MTNCIIKVEKGFAVKVSDTRPNDSSKYHPGGASAGRATMRK